MKREPKQPKRARAMIRAAARKVGGGLFVAEPGSAPARLLNLDDTAGPYVEGMHTIPGRGSFQPGAPLVPQPDRIIPGDEASRVWCDEGEAFYGLESAREVPEALDDMTLDVEC